MIDEEEFVDLNNIPANPNGRLYKKNKNCKKEHENLVISIRKSNGEIS